jgi:putative flippase GtrA
LVVNALLLLALVEGTRLDRILAQALVLPLVSVLTFALNRRWAFRGGRARWPRDLATASQNNSR